MIFETCACFSVLFSQLLILRKFTTIQRKITLFLVIIGTLYRNCTSLTLNDVQSSQRRSAQFMLFIWTLSSGTGGAYLLAAVVGVIVINFRRTPKNFPNLPQLRCSHSRIKLVPVIQIFRLAHSKETEKSLTVINLAWGREKKSHVKRSWMLVVSIRIENNEFGLTWSILACMKYCYFQRSRYHFGLYSKKLKTYAVCSQKCGI